MTHSQLVALTSYALPIATLIVIAAGLIQALKTLVILRVLPQSNDQQNAVTRVVAFAVSYALVVANAFADGRVTLPDAWALIPAGITVFLGATGGYHLFSAATSGGSTDTTATTTPDVASILQTVLGQLTSVVGANLALAKGVTAPAAPSVPVAASTEPVAPMAPAVEPVAPVRVEPVVPSTAAPTPAPSVPVQATVTITTDAGDAHSVTGPVVPVTSTESTAPAA
jgi:hypothetical protein